MRRSRTLPLPLAGLIALGAGLLVIGAGPARADGSFSGTGTAEATGERTTYSIPNYLVVSTPVDIASPIAQSTLGSGSAQGFASLPYPGDTVVNAGALADVATGQNLPYSYPLYAVASDPLTPTAHVQDGTGTVVLDAAASASQVTATASADNVSGSAVNTAGSVTDTKMVVADDGTVTSTADSIVRGIDAGILQIGEVHTHSVTTLAPGSTTPSTTSSTSITGASAEGMTIGFDAKGLTLGPAALGAPYAPVLASINAALSAQGISVHMLGPTPIAGGDSTSGLEIDQTSVVPVPGNPQGFERTVLGEASTNIVVGQSFNSGTYDSGSTEPVVTGGVTAPDASSPAVPSANSPKPTPSAPAKAATGPTPSTTVSATTTGSDAAPPAVTTDAGSAPVSAVVPVPQVAQNSVPAGAAATTRLPVATRAQALAIDFSAPLNFFYLVIVLGAGAVFVASLIWRAKGVRAIWTS